MTTEWKGPFPFGYAAAADSAGSVAAPLLAGFSFTLVGLVIPSPERFRWPSLTLVFLVSAGVVFIAAVQAGFWARQFATTPDDIRLWRPNYTSGHMHALQRLHASGFMIWNARMNRAYRAGITLLLIGVTLSLVPRGHVGWVRALAVVVAVAASVLELIWIAAIWVLDGSPTMVFDDQADKAQPGIRHQWLRQRRFARRVARVFVPLPRITLSEEEKAP